MVLCSGFGLEVTELWVAGEDGSWQDVHEPIQCVHLDMQPQCLPCDDPIKTFRRNPSLE